MIVYSYVTLPFTLIFNLTIILTIFFLSSINALGFFFNEEFIVFLTLILFFWLIYINLKTLIKRYFFINIEYIYVSFFQLICLNLSLIKLFKSYLNIFQSTLIFEKVKTIIFLLNSVNEMSLTKKNIFSVYLNSFLVFIVTNILKVNGLNLLGHSFSKGADFFPIVKLNHYYKSNIYIEFY